MKKLHFVGIGGAGMAPLAEIALERGFTISGTDREANAKTAMLSKMGASIHIGHGAEFLPEDADLLVYSSAVTEENPERCKARNLGMPQARRGEFLGQLTQLYRRCVAISGSHGKTSITSMLVHTLRGCGYDPGYLIGGVVPELAPGHAGDGDIFVTEADESDGTHTALHPWIGIVPNADDDHSWSVGGEAALRDNFRKFAMQSKTLLYYADCVAADWFAGHPNGNAFHLGDAECADLAFWHGFQRRNAFLAVEAAVRLGAERSCAVAALRSFPGVARRMTIRYAATGLTILEDYAHHPVELANSVEFLRAKYPGHHLRILFQPHRYARLAKYLPRFAEELGKADSVVLVPVFAAWTESGPTGSADLAAAIGASACLVEGDWATVATATMVYEDERPLLLAVIGAGDIEKVFDYLPR